MSGQIAAAATQQFDNIGGMGIIKQLASDFFVNEIHQQHHQRTAQQLEDLFYPKIEGSTETLINTRLGRINVTHGGNKDGKALVLWPSLMMKGSMWNAQFDHFKATNYVVLIDSPGINKSDPLRRIINLRDCRDALVDILDYLKIDKCIFAGNSWGAMMAGPLASEAEGWGMPDRLYGTIVVNGTASLPTFPETVMMTARSEVLSLNAEVPDWWVRLAQDAFSGQYAKDNRPDFMDYLKCVQREDPKSIAWAIRGILLGRVDTHKINNTIKNIPVLVIAGEQDQQFSVAMNRSYADSIPTSKFVVIPNTAHLASRENPEAVNKEFEIWFKENGF